MSEDNPIIEAALAYRARGWRPILLHGINSKTGIGCTCRDPADCRSAGKHPVESEWQKLDPMTEDEIRSAWSGWRANHNVGIATGRESGFWVLDIDPDNGGMESAKKLAAEHPGAWEPTIVVKTGSGGFHYYFTLPEDFEVTNARGALKDYPGLDVRGNGGQVVAPPSATDKGDYRRFGRHDEIGPAPAWLLEMIRPKERPEPPPTAPVVVTGRHGAYAQKAWDGEVARLTKMAQGAVPEGQTYVGEPWDATTFEVACNLLELANAGWTPYTRDEAIHAVLLNAPTDSGFTTDHVAKKITSAVETVGDKARPAPADRTNDVATWDIPTDQSAPAAPRREWPMRSWDDQGNAQRMVDHFGDRIRYVPAMKVWALYDGGRWAQVETAVMQSLFLSLTDSRTGALANTEALSYDDTPGTNANGDPTPSDRERFMAFVAKQRMNARVTAAMNLTMSMVAIHAAYGDFDADPMLLNVSNGVIDLGTGLLRAHDPDLMLMKQTPVAFDPQAACPGWDRFLERVMPDQAMRLYLQRIIGYSLTASMSEQAFFIHFGAGANGKSVMLQVMHAVLGEYAQSVPRDTLLAKRNSEHPTSVARMAGMRFLEVSETGPGKRLDEEMVKGLTGGEKQTARLMGKDFFDFTPTGKIHYVTNYLPRLSDAEAVWRRLHLVRWGVRIPEAERNKHLADQLVRDELPGILAWCVRGVLMWNEQGLNPPAASESDITSYREDMDSFGDFLREHTVEQEGTLTKTNDLYQAYKTWAFGAGVSKPMTQSAFVSVMKERGFEYVRRSSGRYFKGLTVLGRTTVPPSPWSE